VLQQGQVSSVQQQQRAAVVQKKVEQTRAADTSAFVLNAAHHMMFKTPLLFKVVPGEDHTAIII